jgi:iron complex transport system substrate-binding protein
MTKGRKVLVYLTGFAIGCAILMMMPREDRAGKRHPWHDQTAPEGTYPLEVVDDLGRTVRFEKQPRHFISLAPSLTEILFAMEMGDHLMAVTQWCRHPAEANALRQAGAQVGRIDQPDLEMITAYRPDLILGTSLTAPETYRRLDSPPRTVSLVLNQTGMDDIIRDVQTVGIATGVPDRAHRLIKKLRGEKQAVESRLAPHTTGPPRKVLFLLSIQNLNRPGWAPGRGTYLDGLITAAHAENVTAEIGSEWGEVSLEALLLLNPEVILLREGESPEEQRRMEETVASLADHPVWSQVEAVRNQRLHWIPNGPVSIPGPRVTEAYAHIAEAIWQLEPITPATD